MRLHTVRQAEVLHLSATHNAPFTVPQAKEKQSSRLGQSSGAVPSQQGQKGAVGGTYQALWASAQSVCLDPGAGAGRTAARLQGSSGVGSSPRPPR